MVNFTEFSFPSRDGTHKCNVSLWTPEGEPRAVELGALTESHELAEPLWDSLNEDNKVSLYVRLIDLNGGGPDSYIINQNC